MSTRAKPQKSTHTHTHTHTHTDSLITSLKQIGTICLAISLFTIPNFTFATNIPTTNPGCTTTVLGADNVANRSAALEPDFHANTINTTWYSNGEPLTGNNIPGTCTYDAPLVPPTPDARPGYTFGGWTLRVPAGPFDNLDASINGTSIGYYNACSHPYGDYTQFQDLTGQSFNVYEWGVQLSNGGVIRGSAECEYSARSETYYGMSNSEINEYDMYWSPNTCYSFGNEGEDYYGGYYCWCKVTGYQASGAALQTDDSTSWVFLETIEAEQTEPSYGYYGCPMRCAARCATVAQNSQSFRAALYGQSQ